MPPKSLKIEIDSTETLTTFETNARKQGFELIAGVDEVGRGPLAGPVVAAACIIKEGLIIEGIDDSKLLSPVKRQALYKQLTTHPDIVYSLAVVSESVIDDINILKASLQAMKEAILSLPSGCDFILVDGPFLPDVSIPGKAIIQGDGRSQAIAAASIIAKEHRDTLMRDYHQQYPQYGFNQHYGYATELHRQALSEYGPCPIHRRSFEPIKSMLLQLT